MKETNQMFDLKGKIALVTGASGGIGSQIASALHGQGANVILHGTRADRLVVFRGLLASALTVCRLIFQIAKWYQK